MTTENKAEDNKVYIKNLPFKYDEDDLKSKFSGKDCAAIEVNIIRFRGYSKGYGFITYEDKESAERAIVQFNDTEHEGRKVTLKFAKAGDENRKPKGTATKGKGQGKKGERVGDKTLVESAEVRENGDKSKSSSLLEPRKHDDFDDSNVREEGEIDYEENKPTSKPYRKFKTRGRGRGRFGYRNSYRSNTVSENTVYVTGIPFNVTDSQQLLDDLPEKYKELVSHAKIAKSAIIKDKVTDGAAIDEEIKLLGKGFGFLQFKNDDDCKKFLEEYGAKNKNAPELFIKGRKVKIYESSKDLTKTDN